MTRKLTFIIIALVLLCSCGPKAVSLTERGVADILSQMRSDPALKAYADSMGVEQLGEGTVCLDPVKHLYRRSDRHFLYNEDWGGVLELPEGWIPEDDLWQAAVSFHGTCVWSPDSTVLLSTYAGYTEPDIDRLGSACESLEEAGFTLGAHEETWMILGDEPARCLSILARGKDGIIYLGKTVTTENSSIEYSVSLQYDENEKGDRIDVLKSYIERYPLGPEGQTPIGDALI